MTKTPLQTAIAMTETAGLIPAIQFDRRNFQRRASRAYQKSLLEPGDSAGDQALLLGLAIAQAQVGIHAGWIPEVQKLGVAIAEKLDWRFGPVATSRSA